MGHRGMTIFSLLLFLLLPVQGQVTIFPVVDRAARNEQVEVMRVEVKESLTVIDFLFHPSPLSGENGNWTCVDRSTYITPTGREERLYMIMAKDISICPKMTKIYSDEKEPFTYRLSFPPLPQGVLKIDIVGRNSRLEGVNLTNMANYPPADSAPFRTQEAFLRFFYARLDSLDPIEGLWKLLVRRQHYMGAGNYLDEEALPPTVVAIMRKGDVFETYDDTGRNRREYFRKLSGKKGYFFRTVYPEVEGEASAYTIFSGPDRFYLKYELPERLTHYYLLGEYLPGTRMIEIAEYRRVQLSDKETGRPVFDLSRDSSELKDPSPFGGR